MTWSLNAHGSTGDIEAQKSLMQELREVLSKPHFGTHGSQFSGLPGMHGNFHLDTGAASPPPETEQVEEGSTPAAPPQDATPAPS